MQHVLFGLILIASTSVFLHLGRQRGPLERQLVDRFAPPPLSSWSTRAVRIATLGHKSLYDDFVTIWTLQLLADPNLKNTATAEQVRDAVLPALKQHPKSEALYLLSLMILGIDYDKPEYGEEIALLALQAFPNSWRIPMTQGFVASFRQGNKGKAAAYYGLASTRPNSPDWVQRLAIKLANADDSSPLDLNETIQALREIPGSTKLLEILRPRFKEQIPALVPAPPTPVDTTLPVQEETSKP